MYTRTKDKIHAFLDEGAVWHDSPGEVAAACGAVYVSRWTSIHIRRLTESITRAMLKPGFSFVEVMAACPTAFGRRNRMREALDIDVVVYHLARQRQWAMHRYLGV